MEVDFQGFEIETPLGGISIGRGYSRSVGTDYFQGIAIRLPMGRLRIGRRMWGESIAPEDKKQQAVHEFLRHLFTAAFVVVAVIVLDSLLDPGDHFVLWLALIWTAVLLLQGLQILMDRLLNRESSSASGAEGPQDRKDGGP